MSTNAPLLVTFLADAADPPEEAPRLWILDAADPDDALDLGARSGERELLGALALPAVLRRRPGTVGARSRAEVRDGLGAPLRARGTDLDRRVGRDASTRSRRVAGLRGRLAGRGLDPDDVLPPPAGGEVELRACAVDLVLLIEAAGQERWEDGARLLGLAQGRAGRPVPRGLAPERFALPEAVSEPEGRALLEEAVAAVLAGWERSGHPVPSRPPRARRPRRRSTAAAAGLLCAALALTAGVLIAHARDAPEPVVLTVDNRVTAGTGMREDTSPVLLSTRPVPYCTTLRCDVAGTARSSGGTYDAAVCATTGSYVTNGNDSSSPDAPDDDDNPDLVRTTGYYGVRLRDGTFGYVSEAWISRRQRGGLGLPPCPR